ncbi:MAG: DNA internalization-related competence protein ComEC/Rec2 [Thalassotalea sp.]|nr:DNA internalization-related competence protein ComEC/Rec2 [Thalassotalea sp.]
MERWLLSFILGAILSLLPSQVPALFYEYLLITSILILLCFAKLRLIASFSLGVLWIWSHSSLYQGVWQANQINPEHYFYQRHQATVEVIDIPYKKGDSWHFVGNVVTLDSKQLTRPFLAKLRSPMFISSKVDESDDFEMRIANGDTITAAIKLKPAHGLANPGSFSYQRWLRSKNIRATGYIPSNAELLIQPAKPSLRSTLHQNFSSLIANSEHSHLLLALTFGERSGFTQETWQVLTATGTQHLVAISGLHIGLVVGFCSLAVLWVLRFMPFALLSIGWRRKLTRFNVRITVVLLSALGSVFYSYLANFSVPTVRALIFCLIWSSGQVLPLLVNSNAFASRSDNAISRCLRAIAASFVLTPSRLILFSMVVTILVLPTSIYSTGFWLSYIAVIIIMLIWWCYARFIKNYDGMKRYLLSLLVLQVGLSVLMIPITALAFQQFSLVTILANLVALPLVSLVTMPAIFLALLLTPLSQLQVIAKLNQLVIEVADGSLALLWEYLMSLAGYQWSYVKLSQADVIGTVAITVLLVTIVLVNSIKSRLAWRHSRNVAYFASLTIAIVVGFIPASPPASSAISTTSIVSIDNLNSDSEQRTSDWALTMLDVGQGLALVIERRGRAILYDTGNSYPSGWNMAEAVIIPYLRHQSLSPDKLIISHDDQDHAGGLSPLLNKFPDMKLVFNKQLNQQLSQQQYQQHSLASSAPIPMPVANKINDGLAFSIGQPHIACKAGGEFSWQGLNIKVLWPLVIAAEENDDSCVLLVSEIIDGKKAHQALITGDISRRVERQLINRYPALNARVLVAPHHGSKSSSSKSFINAVKPEYVLFSAGYLHHWRMPNSDVVARCQRAGVVSYNTAEHGMVKVKFSKGQVKVDSYRRDYFPYWFAN